MRIDVLCVPGCPNYEPAVARIQKVLASEALQAEVHGVAVSSDAEAKVLLFSGSPTVRVNGHDVEPNHASSPGLSCRLYANRSGVPSEEILRIAISEAKNKRQHEGKER
jgi:hypothetical protein